MKRVLHLITVAISAFVSHGSQMAFIALNASTAADGKLPDGWQVKVKDGRPDIALCTDSETPCVRLKSNRASFGLERRVKVDLSEMPYLSWSWKVTQLPQGGDFRRAGTDDQAAQVLVAFNDNRVLSYIWDTTAPKDMVQSASNIPLVHIWAFVCQSGSENLNRWIRETRNVAADYQRVYKRQAPAVSGLRLQINSQHTGTLAESYFGEVAFRSTPQE